MSTKLAMAPSQAEDEAACARLCVDFANHIDARRYEQLLDLFTDDATLDRMGAVLSGRDEIERFLASRPTAVVTRHLCTNIRVSQDTADEAAGFCYVLFCQGGAEDAVPTMAGAPSIVEYHDRYTRTPAGWRIQTRRICMALRA